MASRSSRPTASPRSSAGSKRDPLGQKLDEVTDELDGGRRQGLRAQAEATVCASPSRRWPSRRRTCRSSCRSGSPRPTRSSRSRTAIGSGPFKFVKDEWVPGNKVVYVKNTDYVPRKEPPSWASGGKVVKVDRVEWIYIPDSATAAAALNSGEVDWWQQAPADLVPLLAKNKDIKVENTDPLGPWASSGSTTCSRRSTSQSCARRVLASSNQEDYMLAIAGDAKNGKLCPSFFTCGSPFEHRRLGSADRQARLRKGQAADQGVRLQGREDHGHLGHRPADRAQPRADDHRAAALRWPQRRARRQRLGHPDHTPRLKGPVDKGGWNIFHTWWVGPDMATPAINVPCAARARRRGSAGQPTPSSRSCATRGSAPDRRRRRSSARRCRTRPRHRSLRADRAVRRADRLSLQYLGPADLPDRLPVERREEVGSRSI